MPRKKRVGRTPPLSRFQQGNALKTRRVKHLTAAQKVLPSPLADHCLVKLDDLLLDAKQAVSDAMRTAEGQSHPASALHVFFSFTDATRRAEVVHFNGPDIEDIWHQAIAWCHDRPNAENKIRWLRVDWVTQTWDVTWRQCQHAISTSKRNYFRYGITLDRDFIQAFLEQELNANAMLYNGPSQETAGLNKKNFAVYAHRKYGKRFQLPDDPEHPVSLFATRAVFLRSGHPPVTINGFGDGQEGRDTGRRVMGDLKQQAVRDMIDQASRFLARQVDDQGQFVYGIFPCFDRQIDAYNTLRHTSTIYSMLEAWEVTRHPGLKASIDRAIAYLIKKLLRNYVLPSGETVTYLRDANYEIKLGGSAVCLLALVKYTELTEDKRYYPLLERLALGVLRLQDQETGQFTHVLNADDLTVKEHFRIIYYDGEAAFGLMRLYGLTKDPRWLEAVEKAFEYFIEQNHWKVHDHWLGYCVNELTLYRPEERYFQFGLQNVAGHLDFVIDRITTFPTLLELMMAAQKMISRLEQDKKHRHLLEHIDLVKFDYALNTRARYLLNGFFWPEVAMYFENPQRILGSFFIRHHSFRVRIDDVEHYLSGYVSYLVNYLQRRDIHLE